MSAVGEAFNNIVVHAYGNSGQGTAALELSWNQAAVTVCLRNKGQPFDFDGAPALALNRPHERGMGIHIIRRWVDSTEYRAGSPNLLVLTKLLITNQRPK